MNKAEDPEMSLCVCAHAHILYVVFQAKGKRMVDLIVCQHVSI